MAIIHIYHNQQKLLQKVLDKIFIKYLNGTSPRTGIKFLELDNDRQVKA